MPRKQSLEDTNYCPDQERRKKRKIYNASRTRAQIRTANSKRRKEKRYVENLNRSKKKIQLENSKRTKEKIQLQNSKRTKEKIKLVNAGRKLKSDSTGMEYNLSSPFPPTVDQLNFCGQILGNSIASLFSQQTPSPEISYAAIVAEQLKSYTQPLIELTMHQFQDECCDRLFGDLNFAKASANKALDTLEKILVINDHYQLMQDFSVWDIFNPPTLTELKHLSARHPYQPISDL